MASTFNFTSAAAALPTGFTTFPVTVATTGNDTTPANNTQFISSLWVPVGMTVTNINYLIGSVGGTDKVYAVLYDSTGAVLGNSVLTAGGATVGTAANIQTLALTSTVAITGPGLYFIGVSMNGNTARIRTIAAHCQNGALAGTVTQTHGTVATVVAPATFTANQGCIAFIN